MVNKSDEAMLLTLREAQKQPNTNIYIYICNIYILFYKELLAVMDCLTVEFIPVLRCDAASLLPTVRGDPSLTT